ncbi:MAG: response regulator [Nitrospiraceae bacterium]
MADPLHILIIEDQGTDVELVVRELRKQGFAPTWKQVDRESEFRTALLERFDIILADANMPHFSARRALEILAEALDAPPCIIVSGSIGEEEAVALVRAGASDYILKDRMARLGDAVRGVLHERGLRTEVQKAHKDLHRLNQELERRIAERTLELERANQALARDLEERRLVEDRLRQLASTLEQRVSERTQELAGSYERLRALASDLTLAEQTERRRLAAELHDYLAQLLVVARMKLAQVVPATADQGRQAQLKDVDQLLVQSLDYTRSLVSKLTPQALYEFGIGAAILWLADQLRRQQGFEVVVSGHDLDIPLPEPDAVLLFQSVRELLFNVIKHGQTDRAWVALMLEGGMLHLTVRDGGVGFDLQAFSHNTPEKFGLFSIRERMIAMGGVMDLESQPGRGTTVALRLPLSSNQPNTTAEADVEERAQGSSSHDHHQREDGAEGSPCEESPRYASLWWTTARSCVRGYVECWIGILIWPSSAVQSPGKKHYPT